MRFSKGLRIGAAAAALAVLAACGGGSGGSGEKKLVVGIKFDQPGVGQKAPDGTFTGFDVDVAKFIAKELGVDEKNITFTEAKSADRESLLKKGDVDFITASYSITDKRKNEVDFAGPYLVTGQDLLVRANETTITGPESLNGKKLCSVKGSTSAQTIVDRFAKQAQLQQVDGYSQCMAGLDNGTIDAASTDATILAGLAAQAPGKYKLIGKIFTEERYGVGLKKGDPRRADINKAIEKMISSGEWKKALERNLGPAGFQIPEPPTITEK